jgi:hypothetical protein
MNILDLLQTYKEHRRHYIALKRLVDAEVKEELENSDKEGTELALALENTYHLSDLRKEIHELYRKVRINRRLNFPEAGYNHYSIWYDHEVE